MTSQFPELKDINKAFRSWILAETCLPEDKVRRANDDAKAPDTPYVLFEPMTTMEAGLEEESEPDSNGAFILSQPVITTYQVSAYGRDSQSFLSRMRQAIRDPDSIEFARSCGIKVNNTVGPENNLTALQKSKMEERWELDFVVGWAEQRLANQGGAVIEEVDATIELRDPNITLNVNVQE